MSKTETSTMIHGFS